MQGNLDKRQLLDQLLTQAEKVRKDSVYKAESLGRPAYDLAEELMDDNAKAKAMYYIYIGSYYGKKEDYQYLLHEALKLISSDEELYIVRFYNILGLENMKKGCYSFALDYFLAALNVAQASKHNELTCMVLNNTGEVFRSLGDHERAVAYYLEAYELLGQDKENIEGYCSYALDNLIVSYCQIGDHKKAKYYLDILEEIRTDNETKYKMFEYSRGCYFKAIEAYDQAIKCFNVFLNQIEKLNMVTSMIDAYKCLGDCYFALGKYYNAIDYYVKGHEAAGTGEYSDSQMYCSGQLAKIYKLLDKPDKAIQYYEGFGDTYFEWLEKSNNLRSDYMMHKLQFLQLKEAKNFVEEEHRQALLGHEIVQKSYRRLDLAVTIGNALKSNPSSRALLLLLNSQVKELMEVASIGLGRYDELEDSIHLLYIVDDSPLQDDLYFDLKRQESFNMKTCIREKASILFRTREENLNDRLPDYKYQNAYEEIQSALYVPIISSDRVKGILTVQSRKAYAYSEEDLKVLEIISAFFSQIKFDES
jgi:tetratricopeptide (TPR) repeat protein